MAEHGEIVAGASGIGALLGAFFGAWKLCKPGKPRPEKEENRMADVLQRVARLEQRAEDAERRDNEAAARDEAIFSRLNALDKKASATLAILDERRQQR